MRSSNSISKVFSGIFASIQIHISPATIIGKMVGAPWDGGLNNHSHIHLISRGYLLGPISPFKGLLARGAQTLRPPPQVKLLGTPPKTVPKIHLKFPQEHTYIIFTVHKDIYITIHVYIYTYIHLFIFVFTYIYTYPSNIGGSPVSIQALIVLYLIGTALYALHPFRDPQQL